MKSDQELSKTFKVEKLSDSRIYIEIDQSETDPENNGRQAELLAETIGKVVNLNPDKPHDFLIDLTLAGTVSYISPRAREVYFNLPKISKFRKAAIVGHSLMLEISVNLLMQAMGRSQSFKWFSNREEAEKWLSD